MRFSYGLSHRRFRIAPLVVRRIRDAVVVFCGMLLLNSCRMVDATGLSQRDAKHSTPAASAAVAAAVDSVGCSLGLSEGAEAARVKVVARNGLPFQLPSIGALVSAGRPVRIHVVRIAVPAGGARPSAILACLLPASGDYVQRAMASVKQTRTGDWVALAQEVADSGALIKHDIYRAVAEDLLAATFRIQSASSLATASRLVRPPGVMWLPTGDPYPLPTVVVTADANVVVFDTYIVNGLFSSGENVTVTWDMHVEEEQWSQDCDAWNAAMDEYDGECPVAQVDTSEWVLSRNQDVGIELKHPEDYREIRWGSRSDTSGAAVAYWRSAASTIDFHETSGLLPNRRPGQSVAPCLLHMRTAVLPLYIQRTVTTVWTGRDTVYFIAKGTFTLPGNRRILTEIGAPDSTGLLEQMAILRTIRFVHDP
jgi:hypothetical protein